MSRKNFLALLIKISNDIFDILDLLRHNILLSVCHLLYFYVLLFAILHNIKIEFILISLQIYFHAGSTIRSNRCLFQSCLISKTVSASKHLVNAFCHILCLIHLHQILLNAKIRRSTQIDCLALYITHAIQILIIRNDLISCIFSRKPACI